MSQAVIKYHCPVCEREYNTQEEAEKCFVPLDERFKTGDIIRFQFGEPMIVRYPPSKQLNLSCDCIPEYEIATNRRVKKGMDARGCYIGSGLCKAEKVSLKEAQQLVSELRKRLKAAEKFLEMVKQSQ